MRQVGKREKKEERKEGKKETRGKQWNGTGIRRWIQLAVTVVQEKLASVFSLPRPAFLFSFFLFFSPSEKKGGRGGRRVVERID